MRLVIHPDAAADIAEQAAYYASKEAGLGQAFLDEIDASIEMIMAMPEAFPERRRNLRMLVLPRFPFSVLYRIQNQILQILVVRHHARHQDYGLGRQ